MKNQANQNSRTFVFSSASVYMPGSESQRATQPPKLSQGGCCGEPLPTSSAVKQNSGCCGSSPAAAKESISCGTADTESVQTNCCG